MKRMFRIATGVAAGLATAIAVAIPAAASTAGLAGNLNRNQVVYYTTGRTITAGGSNIYLQKTDGPEIDVMWYKCSNRDVHGAWVRFQNSDPTGRLTLGTNFAANTVFCLAAWDHGSNATDTWSGTLWWNVFS